MVMEEADFPSGFSVEKAVEEILRERE